MLEQAFPPQSPSQALRKPAWVWAVLFALLGVVFFGLAQVRSGRYFRGLGWCAVAFGLMALLWYTTAEGFYLVLVAFPLSLLLWLLLFADGLLCVRRPVPARRWNWLRRWQGLALYGACVYSLAYLVALPGVHEIPWRSYRITSASMLPTLAIGDTVLAHECGPATIRHGTLLIFPVSEQDGRKAEYVKRVVGLPGDTLSFTATGLTLNGRPVAQEPAGEYTYTDQPSGTHRLARYRTALGDVEFSILHDERWVGYRLGGLRPVVLGPGQAFVLGDNRDNSRDSRFFGPITLSRQLHCVQGVVWPLARLGRVR